MPNMEPLLTPEGSATLAWLLTRLATNDSLDEFEGPFGDAGGDLGFDDPADRVRLARYLARHGEGFVPAPLVPGVEPGSPGACFTNTVHFKAQSVWKHRDAIQPYLPAGVSVWEADYVEGVCMNRKAPVLHAWGAFPKSERVYDVTYGIDNVVDGEIVWDEDRDFHHYGSPDSMAFVGLRVPWEVVMSIVHASWALSSGMRSVLALPGMLDFLEADPTRPQLAMLRGAQAYLEPIAVERAHRKGVGYIRSALKHVKREIKVQESNR